MKKMIVNILAIAVIAISAQASASERSDTVSITEYDQIAIGNSGEVENPFELKKIDISTQTAGISGCVGAPQCWGLTVIGATVCNNFRPTCYWVR